MIGSILLALVFSWGQAGVTGFSLLPSNLPSKWAESSPHESSLVRLKAGMGMGANAKSKGKKKNGSRSNGDKGKSSAPFDAAASLLKMEKKYDELLLKSAKAMAKEETEDDDMVVSEFVVAARSGRSELAAHKAMSDWVPVAQICVSRPMVDMENGGPTDDLVKAAISLYCREISQAAVFGSPKFRDVPRQDMLYSYESVDSFHKYVYDNIKGFKGDGTMTKAEARRVLKLEDNVSDMTEVKQSYRKLSFQLHPDRFVGVDRTDEEETLHNHEFSQVKMAYETLSSGNVNGSRGSWYQSLGGRSRTDFSGAIDLRSIDEARALLDAARQETAIVGLDPDLVQMFIVRNQNS